MSHPAESTSEPASFPLPEGVVILPMAFADIEEVLALDKVCFPSSWTRESYRRELSNRHCCYLVMRRQGKLLAYAGLRAVGEEAHLSTLCVVPEHRRQGLAKALLARMLAVARERGATRALLEVRERNLAAQELYRGLGFRVITLQRGYYGDSGENALVMWKDL